MPNAIDFQIGSKFTDLVGGAGVENLQDAIKKALEGITLPDVPVSSPDASSPASDLPSWPRPRREGSRWKRWPR